MLNMLVIQVSTLETISFLFSHVMEDCIPQLCSFLQLRRVEFKAETTTGKAASIYK